MAAPSELLARSAAAPSIQSAAEQISVAVSSARIFTQRLGARAAGRARMAAQKAQRLLRLARDGIGGSAARNTRP